MRAEITLHVDEGTDTEKVVRDLQSIISNLTTEHITKLKRLADDRDNFHDLLKML